MSKENEYRTGIDEKPLTNEEYERLKAGDTLYRRITAPQRQPDAGRRRDVSRVAG